MICVCTVQFAAFWCLQYDDGVISTGVYTFALIKQDVEKNAARTSDTVHSRVVSNFNPAPCKLKVLKTQTELFCSDEISF